MNIKNIPVNMASTAESSTPAASSIIDTSLLLCQCIEEWQQSEPEELRDGKLDWDGVAAIMSSRTGKTVVKGDLQTVWKFIAYGKHFARPAQEESITYSDDEDPYYQPFTAVKRNKIYLTANSKEKTPLTERNYLPSTVPGVLDTKKLGTNMKVDVPPHILAGENGITPLLYVSSNELSHSINSTPIRTARIGMLSAQNNSQLVTALRKVEHTTQTYAQQLQVQEQKRLLLAQQLHHQQSRSPPSHAHAAGTPSGKAVGSMVSAGLAKAGVSSVSGAGRAAVPAAQFTPAFAAALTTAAAAQKRTLNAVSAASASAAMPAAKKQYTMPQRTVNGVPIQSKSGNAKPVTLVPVSAAPIVARPQLQAAVIPANGSVLSSPSGVLPPSLVLAPSTMVPPAPLPSHVSIVSVGAGVGGDAVRVNVVVNVADGDGSKTPTGTPLD